MAAAASAGSIKLPSPAPSVVPASQGTGSTGQRSRLSQQVHNGGRGRRATASIGPDADEDAEGEEDIEDANLDDNGDAEDKSIYCFCQERSYGEMIACDNPDCPYQWVSKRCFHWIAGSMTDVLYVVPPSMRKLEAAAARSMVLFRMYSATRECHYRSTGAAERQEEAVTMHWTLYKLQPLALQHLLYSLPGLSL